MLVCHCKVVNDRRIRQEIERGARDVFDVAQACAAGTGCGGCIPAIHALLAEYGCPAQCPVADAFGRPREPAAQPVARRSPPTAA